jgi:two-component system, sensor histidine kinase and response regulator
MRAARRNGGASLRQRLLLLTLLTSGIGLLLGCGAYLLFDLHDAKATALEELQSTADLIGTNAVAALTFDDAPNGEKLLEALRVRPHIRSAALYRPGGSVFTAYVGSHLDRDVVSPPAEREAVQWTRERLIVVRPIVANEKLVGTIRIESDLEGLHRRKLLYLRVTAAIALGLLLTVYLLTGLLGRSITAPIQALAETARTIAEKKAYSERAPLLAGREMRQLGEDFNHMLGEISKRDADLVEARDLLEQRVTERTRDLQVEIAERERADRALRESEELFRTMSAAAPIGIFLSDAEGKCRFVNHRWCEMTMFAAEEALGDGWRQALHPEDRQQVNEHWERNSKHADPYSSSHRYVARDGRIVEVETLAKPLFDLSGAYQGHVGAVQDITERKASEERLRQSEEMFRRLCEVAPAGIVLVDRQGKITYVNEAWLAMTGLSQEDGVRDGWRSVVHPEDLERVQSTRQLAISRGEDYSMSYRYQTKTRGVVWVDTIARSIKDQAGRHTGYVAAIQDVTQHQLAAESLRRSKEAAESANRAKSEFLANMSHEIRTPMNGIIGMTELALDTDLTSEQRNYLSMVRSSADALLGIINDILDFSKIGAGRMELDKAPFSLLACIEEALRPLSLRASQKNLELSWSVDPDIPEYLSGDSTRLRQVIINLAGNAIKFTKEGWVSIRAERLPADEGRVLLRVTVADTGIGIPPEKHEEIFRAFSQADASTTRQFGGTGLGLSISSQLAKLMGGDISLESELGKGAKFFFSALFDQVAPEEVPLPLHRLDLKGCRGLVVDDNEVNRRLLEYLLPMWGMEVTLAESGWVALTRFEGGRDSGKPFSVVLMDKNMPGMDGHEACERLRLLPGGAMVPILILTSSPGAEDPGDYAHLRICKRVSKPILREELREALQFALQRSETLPPRPQNVVSPERALDILLTEDNAINQKLATRLLEKMGHQVTLACNGREAVEKTSRHSFDLILMDIQMPEMGGMEATELLRAYEGTIGRRTPIVAMTAHAMNGDREKCLAGGMDGYISKPIRAERLREEISRVTRSPRGEGREVRPSMQNEKPGSIDRAELLGRVENDEELAREILEIFQSDVVAYRDALRSAVDTKSCEEVRKNAHTFKGMLSNLAAGPASNLASDLEQFAKAGKADEFARAWSEFDQALANVLREVKQMIAGAPR